MSKELFVDTEDGLKTFWCPGCKTNHSFDPKKWTLNWQNDLPTVSPSILTTFYSYKFNKKMRCHIFIKSGKIQYLNDCTHDLKGKIIDMVSSDRT